MIPAFIILFREALEISIILSIIMAATHGIPGRGRWIWAGIAGGVLGSALVALFADGISQAMEGMGQELFNAIVLGIAVLMIGWTVIWMQKHGRELAQKIKHVGKAVNEGELPLYALATVVSLSMWREGAEIVLFMYGIMSTSTESLISIVAGGVAGASIAIVIGTLIYLGLVRMSHRHLFSVTGTLLILLACGMAAQAAGFLTAAGWLPEIIPQLWDSSALLSESSLPGKILHAMLGYSERPSAMQLIFYVATLVTILMLLHITKRKEKMNKAAAAKPAVVAVILAVGFLFPAPASAAFIVESPHVEKGIMEVESKNAFEFDDEDANQHKLELKYGFTSWWAAAIEGEWEKDEGESYDYAATGLESQFQFTEPGEFLLDAGAIVAYEFAHNSGAADKVEALLLLEKALTQYTHTTNFIVEQEVGDSANDNPEFELAWRSIYLYQPMINPGFEYYAGFGELNDSDDFDSQDHRLGPVIYGDLYESIKYELGWLFGLSDGASDNTLKFNIEYEFPF
jgi:high-affinity iron transporter